MPDDGNARTFEAHCSFCRKSNADVDTLIGGIGVFICNECVGVANDVLAKTPPHERKARDHAGDQLRGATTEKLLTLIAGVEPLVDDVTAYQAFNVDLLRARGVSWAEIGAKLGVTRQAAWKRFARGPDSD
ncbi:MAG TPA: ClpX C4-type zinc finger protein [Caulobacteraceae bacterium]|nr:ClpX C4-type zinc finger protein [Caulobacteraceae bacterium]